MLIFSTLKKNIKINLDSNYKPLMEENIQNLALKKREIKKTKENTKKKAKKVTQLRLENEKGVLTEKDLNETTYKVKNGLTNKLFIFSQKQMLKKNFRFQICGTLLLSVQHFRESETSRAKVGGFFDSRVSKISKRILCQEESNPFSPFFSFTETNLFKKKVEAINKGRIKLNHNQAEAEEEVVEGQLLTHLVHRHEPPVVEEQIKVIHQSEDLVVVDKPGSMPIHPCGRYRHNTLIFMLAHQKGFLKLFRNKNKNRKENQFWISFLLTSNQTGISLSFKLVTDLTG